MHHKCIHCDKEFESSNDYFNKSMRIPYCKYCEIILRRWIFEDEKKLGINGLDRPPINKMYFEYCSDFPIDNVTLGLPTFPFVKEYEINGLSIKFTVNSPPGGNGISICIYPKGFGALGCCIYTYDTGVWDLLRIKKLVQRTLYLLEKLENKEPYQINEEWEYRVIVFCDPLYLKGRESF